MKRIKILHIITRLDKGGSSKILLDLAKNLSKEKYEIKIISGLTLSAERDLKSYALNSDIEIIFLNQLRRKINVYLDIIAFFKLHNIIKKEKPFIVHTHTSKAGILGRWAAKLAGVKIIYPYAAWPYFFTVILVYQKPSF